jgi:hypothetical protein
MSQREWKPDDVVGTHYQDNIWFEELLPEVQAALMSQPDEKPEWVARKFPRERYLELLDLIDSLPLPSRKGVCVEDTNLLRDYLIESFGAITNGQLNFAHPTGQQEAALREALEMITTTDEEGVCDNGYGVVDVAKRALSAPATQESAKQS